MSTTEYEIKFTAADVQLLLNSLAEQPLKVSLNLFLKIQQQIEKQTKS